jgi:ABC-type sugar transport system permease subunit
MEDIIILLVLALVVFLYLRIYYHFERRYTKNEREKHSEWNNPDSLNELNKKKYSFNRKVYNTTYFWCFVILFSLVYLLIFLG